MPSPEDIVDAAYAALLGRAPDAEGRLHALSALEAGLPVETYLRNMLASAEYRRVSGRGLRFDRHTPVCALVGDDLRLWLDLADDHVSLPCLTGDYEPSETRFIRSRLRPGDVFVDIGANIGWHALHAARRVGPSGRVHAFEPRSQTFGLLTRSIADNGLADICAAHPLALGAAEQSGRLVGAAASTNGGGFRLAQDESEAFDGMVSEPVRVVALDSLDIGGPLRLIKLDVEGAEPQALKGAQALLARDRPVILVEFHVPALRHVSGLDAAGFAALIAGLGYRIHALTDGEVGPEVRDAGRLGDPHPVNVVLLPD